MSDQPPQELPAVHQPRATDTTVRAELPAGLTSARQARAAVRHAGPGGPPGITCEVTDTSPAMPHRADPVPGAERGRGLAIAEALARASGVRATRAGKPTRFTLALTGRAHQAARQLEHEPEAGG